MRIAIVGAGPAGALTAAFLSKRFHSIDVYEARADPRIIADQHAERGWNVSVSTRGLHALEQAGVLNAVLEGAAVIDGFSFHANGKTFRLPFYGRTISINRQTLAAKIIREVDRARPSAVKWHFVRKCVRVDAVAQTVELVDTETGLATTVTYDVLIGADGIRSKVRAAIHEADRFFEFSQAYSGMERKTVYLAGDCGIAPHCHVHSFTGRGVHLFVKPDAAGGFFAGLSFPAKGPVTFARFTNDPAGLKTELAARLPQFLAAALEPNITEAFCKRPPDRYTNVKCSAYNYGQSTLIIGDAAHGMFPFLSQGANCALDDALVLDGLVSRLDGSLSAAVAAFTAARRPDALAITDLSMQLKTPLDETLLRRVLLALRAFDDTWRLVAETLVPYRDVLAAHLRQQVAVQKIHSWSALSGALAAGIVLGRLLPLKR